MTTTDPTIKHVTIIIEDPDGTKTVIDVPKAFDIQIQERLKWDPEPDYMATRIINSPPMIVDFSFEPIKDEKTGYSHTIRALNVGTKLGI